jgi:nitroreductase
MNVFDAIETRRSVRKFHPDAIEPEKLEKVLEAARISPSAANQQNWKFILVQDKAKIALLKAASYDQPQVGEAPAAIVACATDSREMSCGQQTAPVDVSIAVSYLILEAHELGLGTCWLGHFNADAVKAALDIPENVTVVAFTPIGYPAETPEARPRKSKEEVISYDKF